MAERKEIIGQTKQEKIRRSEATPEGMVDLTKSREVEIPHEIKGWMQKVEEGPSKLASNQASGMTATNDDIYQLPVSKRKFVGGFKKSLEDVTRWLSVFVLRIIKKKQGKVKFKEEDGDNN